MKNNTLISKLNDSKLFLKVAWIGKYFNKDPILQNYDNVGLLIRTPKKLYIAEVLDKNLKV
jgi:hypothetical protein